MQSLARGTGDRLVPLIIRVHLFGRPALHVLARVRTTKEESAHTGGYMPASTMATTAASAITDSPPTVEYRARSDMLPLAAATLDARGSLKVRV